MNYYRKKCFNCMNDLSSVVTVCPYCGYRNGTPPREPFFLTPGTMIAGRYLVGTVVGCGGFSIIYRGWDMVLNRLVGIKEFYQNKYMTRIPGRKEAVVFKKNREEYLSFIRAFINEARTVSQFVEHPNIVNVYDYFEENQTAYMIMELLNGISLQNYIKNHNGMLKEEEVSSITLSLLNALEAIHQKNYIHRDLSPKNIFICQVNGKTTVKLIDFGTACFYGKAGTGIYPPILTPCYAPPEQYDEKGDQGPWTDLYALGAVMYRSVTGRLPKESIVRKQEDDMPPPRYFRPEISEHLNSIIMRAMSASISARFKTDDQFRQALLNQTVVETEKELFSKRRKRRTLTAVGAGVLAACLAAGGIVLMLFQGSGGSLADASVSVWIRVDEHETTEQARKRFASMTAEYTRLCPNIHLEETYYQGEAYDEKLNEALSSEKDIPTLFCSSAVPEELYDQLADVGDIADELEQTDEYYGFGSYDVCFPAQKQIPLSVQLPVVYIYGDIADHSYTRSAKEAIQNSPDQCVLYFDQSLNYLNSYCSPVRETKPEELSSADPSLFEGISLCEDTAGFGRDGITYLIADTSLFSRIDADDHVKGKLQIAAQDGSTLFACFDDVYSISSTASDAERKAAAALLKTMLSRSSQSAMNYGSEPQFHALPLHKESFRDNQDTFNLPDLQSEMQSVSLIGEKSEDVRTESRRIAERTEKQ